MLHLYSLSEHETEHTLNIVIAEILKHFENWNNIVFGFLD